MNRFHSLNQYVASKTPKTSDEMEIFLFIALSGNWLMFYEYCTVLDECYMLRVAVDDSALWGGLS